jgi:hypothetical protein
MRTALFICEPSLVIIGATDPRDQAVICRYNGIGTPAIGKHELQPGIYRIYSNGPLVVNGVRGDVQTVLVDKDPWPDPRPVLVALERGATTTSIKAFFTIAKDESIDDKPAPRPRPARTRRRSVRPRVSSGGPRSGGK